MAPISYIMCYISLLPQQQQLCSINNNTFTFDPLLLSPNLFSFVKTPALVSALLTERTIPAGLRMRANSSLPLAFLLLLLLPSAEMKRPGKGRGLRGARHKLTRDRYVFTLWSNLLSPFFTCFNNHV